MRTYGLAQKILIFLFLFSVTSLSFATPYETPVKNAYADWCNAISSSKGNAQEVVKYYAQDAVLLPTLSAKILRNNKNGGMVEYFTDLTSRPNIKCTPETLITQMVDDNVAVNSGYYEFSYMDNGTMKKVPARFNFVYKKMGNAWMIVNHHSSVLP